MASVSSSGSFTMQGLTFPALADRDFNGPGAAAITADTITYVEGDPSEQGLRYTFSGTFTFTRDAGTGVVSDVAGTVRAIRYEFADFANAGNGDVTGGFLIEQIATAVSSFQRADASVAPEILSGGDLITGSSSPDFLVGFAGNDTLRGSDGSNRLDGGLGADFMAGGRFRDIYLVDDARDAVIEFASEGEDLVLASVTHRLQANVENLTLDGNAAINGVGNELANQLSGNFARNYLYGNAGNDVLSGRVGNDVLTGGEGRDAFLFQDAPNAASNVDKVLDFSVADDHFRLQGNAVFASLPTGFLAESAFRINKTGFAQDASDRIIYESDTGELYYDSNGDKPGGSALFAIAAKDLALTRFDFLVV